MTGPLHSFLRLCVLALLCLAGSAARADKFSDSYLSMRMSGNAVEAQWDIALRDLEAAIGLDRDGNGDITWDEVRAKHADIAAYAFSRLAVSVDGGECVPQVKEQLIEQHSDGAYSALRFLAVCPAAAASLNVRYSLLFDIDPQHKGLLKLESAAGTSTAVFSPDRPAQSFSLERAGRILQFAEYLKTGVWHIWNGFDHLLFLLSLLLPAVLALSGTRWQPAESFRNASVDVLKIVTAFTAAHSITLTLATLQIVALPSRWVESAIAASVVIAALNNLYPVVRGRRWAVAFVFGLIHGFGFASVLTDLGLPRSTLAIALVGFNLGVEAGQLAIVAAFLPMAYALRQTWFYRKLVFTAGSTVIVAIASVWLIERAFDLKLLNG
jgi:hypothetical protein